MSTPPTTVTNRELYTVVANLEQRLTELSVAIDRQNMQIGELFDLIGGLRNSTDWSAAQIGELLRVLFTSIQQIRDTQISSLLAEGPITLSALQQLRTPSHDQAQTLLAARRAQETPGASHC